MHRLVVLMVSALVAIPATAFEGVVEVETTVGKGEQTYTTMQTLVVAGDSVRTERRSAAGRVNTVKIVTPQRVVTLKPARQVYRVAPALQSTSALNADGERARYLVRRLGVVEVDGERVLHVRISPYTSAGSWDVWMRDDIASPQLIEALSSVANVGATPFRAMSDKGMQIGTPIKVSRKHKAGRLTFRLKTATAQVVSPALFEVPTGYSEEGESG